MTLTAKENAEVEKLREKLGKNIPKDLNADFNLLRWSHSSKGNVEEICRNFWDYVESRHVAGFDRPDFEEKYVDLPIRREYHDHFSFMNTSKPIINRNDNGVLLLERIEGLDIKSVMKTYSMSHALMAYFSVSELLLQRMLNLEATTGKRASIVFVLDLKGIHLADFIDPRSPCAKFNNLHVKLWNNWFYEVVSKVLVLNASSFISVAFHLAKFFAPAHMAEDIIFLHKPEELLNHLDADIVPVAYGGKFKDTSGFADNDYCCNVPKPITSSEYYEAGSIWETVGLDKPALKRESIKPHKMFVVEKDIKEKGTKVAWQFSANGDIEFAVCVEEDSKTTLVHPRLTTTTMMLPEEGMVVCEKAGKYRFEFKNNSSLFFPIKLDYAVMDAKQ